MTVTQKVLGNFGRLWGRGHEVLTTTAAIAAEATTTKRRILAVRGKGATTYLQNLVTCDLQSPPTPPRPEPLDSLKPGVPKRFQEQQQQQDTTSSSSTTSTPMVTFSDQLRATCFLDNKGRVVTDSLLWKLSNEEYYLDVPGDTADALWEHLHHYKLRRSKVQIQDCTAGTTTESATDTSTSTDHVKDNNNNTDMAVAVIYGTLAVEGAPPGYLAGLDPRHPSLGMRVLKLPHHTKSNTTHNDDDNSSSSDDTQQQDSPSLQDFSQHLSNTFPNMPGNYELVRRLAGVAEGLEIAGKIALETNQEHLNAVSFDKGCYLGQELTARVHHTGVLRKRVMPLLLLDPYTEIPQPWSLAASLQEGRAKRKFTKQELQTLPGRLPRLSVLTAGNLVAISTGAVEPPQPPVDDEAAQELKRAQERAAALLQNLEETCVAGAKLVDTVSGKTIGQVLSPPVKGTNVVLALMRLESVGLLTGGVWSKTNRIHILGGGDDKNNNDNNDTPKHEFRYLPYLPLWWPELDPETGKAKEGGDESVSELEVLNEGEGPSSPRLSPRIEIEHVPIAEEEASSEPKQ